MIFNLSLAVAAALAFFILLIKGFSDLVNTFVYSSYYLLVLLFLVWLMVAVKHLVTIKFDLGDFLKRNWLAISASLLLTGMIFCSVERNFKTLNDETNLLSVS